MGKSCFQSKNAAAIHDLILWSENCRIGKRNPKEIPSILYRNVPSALMMNYETKVGLF
jgi:hypothetical protein